VPLGRWVQTISDWNASLSEQDCFAVVKCWFGLQLRGVRSFADLEMGFPDKFFTEAVYSETRRMLDAVGDDSKIIAWVLPGAIPTPGIRCRLAISTGSW